MAKTKASSKKQQKRGVDFKKIKRKLGRKLPPPKNATNTEIKSKAIILPEQSVASDKAGLALSKKGLTLKELLQQTSHHNAKVRKDALIGLKDLFISYPEELKRHIYAVIEKLCQRISDDDKMVRETLYQLLKSVVLPGCKEDTQVPFTSLTMAYIFNAMTHLAVEVRLTAFKFFDLVVQHDSFAFSIYAEKVLENFREILQKNSFYLEDKGKLKNVLAGLVRCLSLLPSNKTEPDSLEKKVVDQKVLHAYEPDMPAELEFSVIFDKLKDLLPALVNCLQDFIPSIHNLPLLDAQSFDCMVSILRSIDLGISFFVYGTDEGNPETMHSLWDQNILSFSLKKLLALFPLNSVDHLVEKDDYRYFTLNVMIAEIYLHLSERICPSVDVLEKFLVFIANALLGKIWSDTSSGRAVIEKQILKLIPFIPKLAVRVSDYWKSQLLQAFTRTFLDSNPVSPTKLLCLSAIKEMFFARKSMLYPEMSDSEILDLQVTWIRMLPQLLLIFGSKHASSSQIVLHLLLRLGQCSMANSYVELEYDKVQYLLRNFFSTVEDGNLCYGPFIKLPKECQELSIFCINYFSHLDPLLLRSIASCCICPELDESVLFRMIEVLHLTYLAGRIHISDHFSFFITLLSCFKVFPEDFTSPMEEGGKISNRGTFKSLGKVVRSYLLQMGDKSVILRIIEDVIVEHILLRPPLDNACSMLRVIIVLDLKPTRLSKQSISRLSNFLPRYLIAVVHHLRGEDDWAIRRRFYYVVPCFIMFDRSHELLSSVLNVMSSLVSESGSISPCDHPQHPHYTMDHVSKIKCIVAVLQLMHQDSRMKQLLSPMKAEVNLILQTINNLQSSEKSNLSIGEWHKVKCALDHLETHTATPLPWEMQNA